MTNLEILKDILKRIAALPVHPIGDARNIACIEFAKREAAEALQVANELSTDAHCALASRIFGVPVDKVSPTQRRYAKVVSVDALYGMSLHSKGDDV